MKKSLVAILVVFILWGCTSDAQGQISDESYEPLVIDPVYEEGAGPVVCLDEAHNNYHTLHGRFLAFGELLRRDGYVVKASKRKFSKHVLARCDILVIANAQLDIELWMEYPYPTPSAFSEEEIYAVQNWVKGGGALLLIADHMPLAGVASDLAASFGVEFNNGFALKKIEDDANPYLAAEIPTIFSLSDGTLAPHPITAGRNSSEVVTSIRSFTGQAFIVPESAQPLMILPDDFISVMPEEPWAYAPATKIIPVGGWLQGAVMPYDAGRAAFFGEAAMFTAQMDESSGMRIGMNSPMAEQNSQFVLNVMHWLSGILK